LFFVIFKLIFEQALGFHLNVFKMAKNINKTDFYKHLRMYLTWCVLFFIINKVTSPGVNWFIYLILLWGISVFIQAIMVFFPVGDEKVKATSHLPSGKNKDDDFLDLKPLHQKNWKEEDIV
jgi:hypothetical protein